MWPEPRFRMPHFWVSNQKKQHVEPKASKCPLSSFRHAFGRSVATACPHTRFWFPVCYLLIRENQKFYHGPLDRTKVVRSSTKNVDWTYVKLNLQFITRTTRSKQLAVQYSLFSVQENSIRPIPCTWILQINLYLYDTGSASYGKLTANFCTQPACIDLLTTKHNRALYISATKCKTVLSETSSVHFETGRLLTVCYLYTLKQK